jgi:hypothetical protein
LKRLAWLLIVAVSIPGGRANAQSRPDFSGTWTTPGSSPLTIKQDAKTLTVTEGAQTRTFNLDGSESRFGEKTAQARWVGGSNWQDLEVYSLDYGPKLTVVQVGTQTTHPMMYTTVNTYTPRTSVGSISGKVLLQGGPAASAPVKALPIRIVNGVRRIPLSTSGVGAITTGEGDYSIANLQPGDYIVVAAPQAWDLARRVSGPAAVTPTYHPSSLELATAEVIHLDPGESRQNVDVSLVLRPPSTITVRVVDPQHQSDERVGISLQSESIPSAVIGMLSSSRYSTAALDTPTQFMNLPSGRYQISAEAMRRPRTGPLPIEMLWARATVDINGFDSNEIVLTLREGARLSGKVTFVSHAGTPRPDPKDIEVMESGRSARMITGFSVRKVRVGADGMFAVNGLAPGEHTFLPVLPASLADRWSVESATVILGSRCCEMRGVPITVREGPAQNDVTITMTDRQTEVSGVVSDGEGRPAPANYFIAIVPADRALWVRGSRMPAPVRPNAEGRYRVIGLPPGDYLVMALTALDESAWADGDWPSLDTGSAIKLALASGEQKTLNLRVGRKP